MTGGCTGGPLDRYLSFYAQHTTTYAQHPMAALQGPDSSHSPTQLPVRVGLYLVVEFLSIDDTSGGQQLVSLAHV